MLAGSFLLANYRSLHGTNRDSEAIGFDQFKLQQIMKGLFAAALCLICHSCLPNGRNAGGNYHQTTDCDSRIRQFEQAFLQSCPTAKGPDSLRAFLNKIPGYVQNRGVEYGKQAFRYDANNAMFLGSKLKDDGTFLFFITQVLEEKEAVFFFEAKYVFENEKDKRRAALRLATLLTKTWALTPRIHYDADGEAYERYFLPCGGTFNLKTSSASGIVPIIRVQYSLRR